MKHFLYCYKRSPNFIFHHHSIWGTSYLFSWSSWFPLDSEMCHHSHLTPEEQRLRGAAEILRYVYQTLMTHRCLNLKLWRIESQLISLASAEAKVFAGQVCSWCNPLILWVYIYISILAQTWVRFWSRPGCPSHCVSWMSLTAFKIDSFHIN